MKKFKEYKIDLNKPLSIFTNGKEIYDGVIKDIKNEFTREQFNYLLELEVLENVSYFGYQVFRLKDLEEKYKW